MEIVPYAPRYAQHFIDLNRAWIEEYFTMEEQDHRLFANVEKRIEEGAMIFFAVEEEAVLATCMVVPCENSVWELCKLAADERYKGKGAGSAVFRACMNYAMEQGAKKLVLSTNSRLKPALHIYEKLDFVPVPLDNGDDYRRVDVKLAYDVP